MQGNRIGWVAVSAVAVVAIGTSAHAATTTYGWHNITAGEESSTVVQHDGDTQITARFTGCHRDGSGLVADVTWEMKRSNGVLPNVGIGKATKPCTSTAQTILWTQYSARFNDTYWLRADAVNGDRSSVRPFGVNEIRLTYSS